MDVKEAVDLLVGEKKASKGLENVFFVACGGSLAAFYPAKVLLESETRRLRVGWVNASEFIHALPSGLGAGSVVILASHGGNTPETVAAARAARAAGACAIGLTWTPDSDLPKNCDFSFGYTFGDERDVADEKTMVGLKIAVEILQKTEGYAHYDRFYDAAGRIDGIVKQACAHVEKRADAFAREYQDEKFIYTIGSGASWSSAYMQSVCVFMEMQWIGSACIHAGEYFHGPFEVTDADTPFILQVAEGRTRPLDERALRFLKKYGKRYEVLDARELGLSVIPAEVVDYFNHSLFNNVYGVYNRRLAGVRNHPLNTRRYMWKVEY